MLQTQNPCAVALIDGDGYPFALHYLRQGRVGGQEAATALKAKLISEIGPDVQLLVFVYLNRLGLADVLVSNRLIGRRSEFDEFITGFNQSSPLFQMIDVGHGKEVADAKIRGARPGT